MAAPKFALVHWIDAAGDFDGDDVEPVHTVTAGYIVAQEKDYLRVASEIFDDGSYRTTTAIPAGMIRTIILRSITLPKQFDGWRPRNDGAGGKSRRR